MRILEIKTEKVIIRTDVIIVIFSEMCIRDSTVMDESNDTEGFSVPI